MGVGAMTDFGPMLANPKTLLLGAAAQFGIFATLLGALALNMIPGLEYSLSDAARIPNVSACKNLSALILEPTDKPKKIVTILINSFCDVLLKRSTTPHTFIKLPKQNIPTSNMIPGLEYSLSDAAAIAIIGGADGPTAIYVASNFLKFAFSILLYFFNFSY
jgi:Na+-transporting methylmalonyl-CoA/oxaloacetate decarboxylase beta subunit